MNHKLNRIIAEELTQCKVRRNRRLPKSVLELQGETYPTWIYLAHTFVGEHSYPVSNVMLVCVYKFNLMTIRRWFKLNGDNLYTFILPSTTPTLKG